MTEPTLTEFNQIILWNLLDERAALLNASVLDGYQNGIESILAEELIYALTPAQRSDALGWLITDKMRADYADGFVLDECDPDSFKTADAMAALLLAEICKQGNEPAALKTLVTAEIWDRRQLAQWMHECAQ